MLKRESSLVGGHGGRRREGERPREGQATLMGRRYWYYTNGQIDMSQSGEVRCGGPPLSYLSLQWTLNAPQTSLAVRSILPAINNLHFLLGVQTSLRRDIQYLQSTILFIPSLDVMLSRSHDSGRRCGRTISAGCYHQQGPL